MTRDDVRRFAANPALIAGLMGVLALLTLALFGPHVSSADPNAQRIVIFFPDGRFLIPPTPPDQYYPLGTDPLGRDQLSRVLYGARLTLTVVLLALLIRGVLAVAVGVASGWRGGAVDRVLTVVTNAVSGIPQFLLALLIAVALREQAIIGFTLALGLVGWAEGAQFIRSEVIRIRSAVYIDAARSLGERPSGILSRHVVRGLGPQLFGLFSLEAGSTLLLLAELGFLGVFMSGGAFLTDAQGRPILPARDRAPEWGQMLAGAQQYAFRDQYVAFVPGVVVGVAVFVFNLLGEGVRAATDPFSRVSLSPRALGALGRGALAVALVSATFFGVTEARATTLSFDDALRLARDSVAKVEPGAPLIAAVVSLRSDAHGLERPSKYNFYFRSNGPTPYWRVGFPDADQNAMETKRDVEDGIQLDTMPPLEASGVADWTRVLAVSEKDGAQMRAFRRTWLVRIVLAADSDYGAYYRAMYTGGDVSEQPFPDVFVDARTATPNSRLDDMSTGLRARAVLGGAVALSGMTMSWNSLSPPRGFGIDAPSAESRAFVVAGRSDDRRVVYVQSSGGTGNVITSLLPQRLAPLSSVVDLRAALTAVEDAGGRSLREQWTSDGYAWQIQANAFEGSGHTVVLFSYQRAFVPLATYSYDPLTGTVTRTQ